MTSLLRLYWKHGVLLVISLVGICISGHSQDLPGEEIEVIKHFEARLIETEKIRFIPRLPSADTIHRQYQYQVSMVSPQIQYDPPQIRPLALRPEVRQKQYRGHLRGGYGVPNAILADASYVYQNGPARIYASAFHQSGNEKKTPLKHYSRSGGTLHGGYEITPEAVVSGQIGYQAEKVGFYGVDDTDPTHYVDETRTFKTFRLGAGIQNAEPLGGDLHYRAAIGFYDHQDDLGTHESGISFISRGEKRFNTRHIASLDFVADISRLTDSEEKRELDNLSLLPAFAYHGDVYWAKAGVNIVGNNSEFLAFPIAELFVKIAGTKLGAFAEIGGELQKNNFLTLSTYNPYIHERIDSIRNTIVRTYAAGVRGKINKIEYEGSLGFLTLDGLALFEQDFFDYRKFQPLYDDGHAFRISGKAEIALSSSLSIKARAIKTIYDLDHQDKAWHLPGLTASLTAIHHSTNNKFHLHGGLRVESGVPYRTQLDDYDTLKGIFDVSIAAEYYFTEHIGAFLHLNNLLGTKSVRWEGYESYGINGVAGILLRI